MLWTVEQCYEWMRKNDQFSNMPAHLENAEEDAAVVWRRAVLSCLDAKFKDLELEIGDMIQVIKGTTTPTSKSKQLMFMLQSSSAKLKSFFD